MIYLAIYLYLFIGIVIVALFEYPSAFDEAFTKTEKVFACLKIASLVITWLPYTIWTLCPAKLTMKFVSAIAVVVGWTWLGMFVMDVSGLKSITDDVTILLTYYSFAAIWYGLPIALGFMAMNHKTKT